MTEEALKPCPVPWCDNPRPQAQSPMPYCFVVKCNECGTRTLYFYTKAEAIAAWNHRTPDPRVAGLVEALEWYGEQARLCRLIHSEGDAGRHALSDDGGKFARAALAGGHRHE
jgi:hypothetical protein